MITLGMTNQKIAEVICKMIGHVDELDRQSQKLVCKRCGREH